MVATRKAKDDLPWLVYLQGGPGFEAPRPAESTGWLGRALEDFRVLLLDQRGTGRSTSLTRQTLERLGSVEEQAAYASHFRADGIVRDAEAIRKRLAGPETPWTLLGQSFGGFCALHYLSAAPEGLAGALITGGIPSLTRPIDDVYRATYPRVASRNEAYYARYPEDIERAAAIVTELDSKEVFLPTGARLTSRRFQQLGLQFGFSDGFEQIHYLMESAFVSGAPGSALSYRFLCELERLQAFDTNPIFALLHEAIYCQEKASRWSAHRIRDEHPRFSVEADRPVWFTGEMIYPWMFEDYAQLRPLRETAELLAAKSDWPPLYDTERLSRNTVPVAAAIYTDDMYVERAFSEETVAAVPNVRTWITSEYDHNGLRADGPKILSHLLELLRGER